MSRRTRATRRAVFHQKRDQHLEPLRDEDEEDVDLDEAGWWDIPPPDQRTQIGPLDVAPQP